MSMISHRTVKPMAKQTCSLEPGIDPSPKPWPFLPAFATLLILSFLSLQFLLPATHFRYPDDPHRVWYPMKRKIDLNEFQTADDETRESLIVVRAEESDLRAVCVAINSTIVNAREPDKLNFGVVVPASVPSPVAFQLKAIFSNANINIIRESFFIEKMKPLLEADNDLGKCILGLLPFYLSKAFPSIRQFVYLDSDIVLQAPIEELFELDMKGNVIAAVEDCSQIFGTFFSFELLEAARSSEESGKPWMPAQPYDPKACLFDRGVMVLDARSWNQRNMEKAMLWWLSLHRKTDESLFSAGHPELPVHLALYQNYTKLNASWSVREPLSFEKAATAKLFHFDKQVKPWHFSRPTGFHKDVAALWWKYISQSTNSIFSS